MLRPSFPDAVAAEYIATAELDTVEMEEQVRQGLEVVAALEELDAITNDESVALESILHQVATEGISRDDYQTIEAIVPGALAGVNPKHLTAQRSLQGTQVALEAINWKKAGVLAVIVAAIAGLLTKLIQWISSKMGGGAAKNIKMADRVAKRIDDIYERVGLADISEAYNRVNPYKGGTHEFSLFETLMVRNAHEDFNTDIYIEHVAFALVEHQRKVKRKNFPDNAVYMNMDYLINSIRFAYMETQDERVRGRVVAAVIGNFVNSVEYTAFEHYIITTPIERSILSAQAVTVALAQYDYFFLIADRYRQLMTDFTTTILALFVDEEITTVKYKENSRMYNSRMEEFLMDLNRGTTQQRMEKQNNAITELHDKLFSIWEEFAARPEVRELNKHILSSRSSVQWLFDTNQLKALATSELHSGKKPSFTQRVRGEDNRFNDGVIVNPAPSGMTTSPANIKYMYGVYVRLTRLNKGKSFEGRCIFNLAPYLNERTAKKSIAAGLEKAMPRTEVWLYGLYRETDAQLTEAAKAIKLVDAQLRSSDYADRLTKVNREMKDCSAMWEDVKTGFNGQFYDFITTTGEYSPTSRKTKQEEIEGAFGRTRINIDAVMKAIFTSIRETSSTLGRYSTYLNGLDAHVLSALSKRAKGADGWKSYIANDSTKLIGPKS